MTRRFFLLVGFFIVILNHAMQSHNGCFFIENKGQWPQNVKFLAKLNCQNTWITDGGIVYDFYRTETPRKEKEDNWLLEEENKSGSQIFGHVVKMTFVNNQLSEIFTRKIIGVSKIDTYYNYLIGNDKSKWASFVPLYKEVLIQNSISGINTRYYFDESKIRYDFIIEPGKDPSELALDFDLGKDTQYTKYINENGELVLKTSIGEIVHGKIFAYQEISGKKIEIPCSFYFDSKNTIQFDLGQYNKDLLLVIDPLIYSTFIGGDKDEDNRCIIVDSVGNAIIAGLTKSVNFPTKIGAYDTTFCGKANYWDVFITKLNDEGSEILFSTYLGGNDHEGASDIVSDDLGYIYITGKTNSSNFPVSENAFQKSFSGFLSPDAIYVTKLNSTGSNLIYSTFIGGSSPEWPVSVILDADKNAYVTGYTGSTDFPVTVGAYQTIFAGSQDVFLTKLNPTGSNLVFSTFIGGNKSDAAVGGIKLGKKNNIYISGSTMSDNFPITPGAYKSPNAGNGDAFILKLDSSGSSIIYSAIIGGSDYDRSNDINIDNNGNVYITGKTHSSDYPVTEGAYLTSLNRGMFVTKLNDVGSEIVYSTFVANAWPCEILLDDRCNSYLCGYTNSSGYPTTSNAYQRGLNGGYDAFFSILNSDGSDFSYSTLIGGEKDDLAFGMKIYKKYNIFITGKSNSLNFPITPGVFQDTLVGYDDVFVIKLGFNVIFNEDITEGVCSGSLIEVPFTAVGAYNPGNIFYAQLSNDSGNFNSPVIIGSLPGVLSGTITALIPGSMPPGEFYKIRVVSTNPYVIAASPYKEITIHPLPDVTFEALSDICIHAQPLILNQAIPEGGLYKGSGVASDIFYPEDAGAGIHEITYTFISEYGCENSATQFINVLSAPEKPQISQQGRTLISSAETGNQWFINGEIIEGAVYQDYTPDSSGYYMILVIGENDCKSKISEPYYFDITDIENMAMTKSKLMVIPNPFTGTTNITWVIDKSSTVSLVITDLMGIEVAKIYEDVFIDFGQYSIEFDASKLPTGVYFCTLRAGGYTEAVKIVVIK